MKSNRSKALIAGLLVLGALTGVGLMLAQARQSSHGGGHARGKRQAVPVLTSKAALKDVPVYLDGVGMVQAYQSVTVKPQITGKIISINFKEGQFVKKGDLLARLDDSTYRASLEEAQAKLAQDKAMLVNAKLDYQRYEHLAKTNYTSKQKADTQLATVHQDEAQLKSDRASIDNAQAMLDYTYIRAPISGRTGLRQVDAGNIVSTSDTDGIVVINQLQPISVMFSLPAADLPSVSEAASHSTLAVEAIDSQSDKVLDKGELTVIDNQIQQATGTIRLKAKFPNPQHRLWPNQFVNVQLLVRTLKKAIVVPSAAVQQGPDGAFVYLVGKQHKARLQSVTVQQESETQAVISQGLKTSDEVITSGFDRLTDGTAVNLGAGDKKQAGVRDEQQTNTQ